MLPQFIRQVYRFNRSLEWPFWKEDEGQQLVAAGPRPVRYSAIHHFRARAAESRKPGNAGLPCRESIDGRA